MRLVPFKELFVFFGNPLFYHYLPVSEAEMRKSLLWRNHNLKSFFKENIMDNSCFLLKGFHYRVALRHAINGVSIVTTS